MEMENLYQIGKKVKNGVEQRVCNSWYIYKEWEIIKCVETK